MRDNSSIERSSNSRLGSMVLAPSRKGCSNATPISWIIGDTNETHN